MLLHTDRGREVRRWRYRFVKDTIGPVSEELSLARPIKYSEILDYDRRIREFEDNVAPPDVLNGGPSAMMKARMLSVQKDLGT